MHTSANNAILDQPTHFAWGIHPTHDDRKSNRLVIGEHRTKESSDPSNVISSNKDPDTVGDNKESTHKKVGRVALKVLLIVGIIIGTAAAIAGAALLTKVVIATGIIAPLIVFGVWAGTMFLYVTAALCQTPVTALGAIITLPMAAISYASPFALPIFIGGLPGVGLIALSAWGWSVLSAN